MSERNPYDPATADDIADLSRCAQRKPVVTVREVHVERGSGNLVRARSTSSAAAFLNLRKLVETSFLIELRCGRDYVRMWPVTWSYIAESVRRHA